MTGAMRRGAGRWAPAGLVLLVFAGALVRGAPEANDTERRLGELAERLKRLEQAVGVARADPTKPTLDHRVTVLEDGLRELSRAGGQTGWSSVSDNLRELQRLLRDNTQRQDDLARRLTALERGVGGGDVDRQLRELRSRLDDLRRQVDDLRSRVTRLETRR